LYACDESWWQYYYADVATRFKGECWTVSEGARERFGLYWVHGVDKAGLAPDPNYIHTGKNSGHQAIGLAHLFGASRIVLLGFDMMATRGEQHWHGNHPKGLTNGTPGRYAVWCRCMEQMEIDLRRRGVCKVLNASRRTALRCFQRVTLETALDESKNPDRTGDDCRVPHPEPCALR
jgi:hypothetical protein